MRVCLPVSADGQIDPRWGRAARVAVADVRGGTVVEWREFDVGWDRLHDETTEGGHHARIARFLQDGNIDTVAAHHMGAPMVEMVERMGIAVRLGLDGDARAAALTVARSVPIRERPSRPWKPN